MAQIPMNFTSFQPLRFSEEMSIKDMARWSHLMTVTSPGDVSPLIQAVPVPKGVNPMAAIMCASYEMEPLWQPVSQKELHAAAENFYADINDHGVFDPTTTTVVDFARSLCENRKITLAELILTMHCPFFAKHRLYALSVNLRESGLHRSHAYRCEQSPDDCICKHLTFSEH
jgi:hypothetical protein